jgi:hypothetical protein
MRQYRKKKIFVKNLQLKKNGNEISFTYKYKKLLPDNLPPYQAFRDILRLLITTAKVLLSSLCDKKITKQISEGTRRAASFVSDFYQVFQSKQYNLPLFW